MLSETGTRFGSIEAQFFFQNGFAMVTEREFTVWDSHRTLVWNSIFVHLFGSNK